MWQRIKNVYHLINAVLANLWFGFPSRHLTVIGVTGTDGKTTTVSLIHHILHKAGYNASMISSVGAVIGEKNYDVGFHVTTPSSLALQRFISLCHPELVSGSSSPYPSPSRGEGTGEGEEMPKHPPAGRAGVRHDSKMGYLVLEVTSHALDQYRVWGIKFDVGVLTNVTHEHLDYHKTYENYVKTKVKLLQTARVAAVNKDDKSYNFLNSKLKIQKSKAQFKIKKLITYGLKTNADVNTKNFPFKTNLIGEFNKYNVLAGIAACRELGVDDKVIRSAVASFKPPIGREEIVHSSAGSGQADFTVMIDFAHTPNSFEEILSSVRPSIKRRLIHVFGSAGMRDNTKRPLMGNASAKYADVIVLTAEDPRTESVEKIMDEIALGIQNYNSKFKIKDVKNVVFKIADRQEAISAAIKLAKKGDFVLITGKAHEKSMNYGNGEEPWDEFGAVKKALRLRDAPDGASLRSG